MSTTRSSDRGWTARSASTAWRNIGGLTAIETSRRTDLVGQARRQACEDDLVMSKLADQERSERATKPPTMSPRSRPKIDEFLVPDRVETSPGLLF